MENLIRHSVIAGSWYPAEPDELSADLDDYLQAGQPSSAVGTPVAIVAPHAGYFYSGRTAGWAFASVRNLQPDVVAVLSPMHQADRAGFFTSGYAAYQTPLGEVPVDAGLVAQLADRLLHEYRLPLLPLLREEEHSLEIELPFLQRIYPQPFTLLPLMVSDLSPARCRQVSQSLADVLTGHSALVVISTDLSHYHPLPVAEQMDACMLDAVLRLDVDGVAAAGDSGAGYACGAGALMTGLQYARLQGCQRGILLGYETSAVSSGDDSAVVGYAAVALVKEA